LNFLNRFFGKTIAQISNFMKIRLVGAEWLVHAAGKHDENKNSRFSQFCELA